ncbi:zf-CCHC domain-containing protein [Tanacetum coccineum]
MLESTRFTFVQTDLCVLGCSSTFLLLTTLSGGILLCFVLLLGFDPLARVELLLYRRNHLDIRRRGGIGSTSMTYIPGARTFVLTELLAGNFNIASNWPLDSSFLNLLGPIALKSKKVSSDEEASCSDSKDEDYAMAVRDFKKFFKRRGKFIRQPHDNKKAFRRAKEEKKGKVDCKCFKCGDPNHFISDCPKHSHNDQKAFVGAIVIKKMIPRKTRFVS